MHTRYAGHTAEASRWGQQCFLFIFIWEVYAQIASLSEWEHLSVTSLMKHSQKASERGRWMSDIALIHTDY
jgi:hypothetical protein